MTRYTTTIAEAITLHPDDWNSLNLAELVHTPVERAHAIELWCWLRGLDPASPEAEGARSEVASDGGMIVALHLPAEEFMHWFRREDWDCFDESDRTDSTEWCWGVMGRALEAYKAMSTMERVLRRPLQVPKG